jgi:hypothetical protein
MHKLLGTLCLAGSILFLSHRIAMGEVQKGELIVPEPTHAFGSVKQGAIVSHAFAIRNSGAAPLKIERMEISRTGITARAKPVIPPGEEGEITVRWDTGRARGEVSGQVVLHLDDPTQPPIVLLLKGVVKPPVEIVPSRPVLLSVFRGESAEQTVAIINNEERPLAITRLEPLGGHFRADVRPVEPGKVFRVSLTLPAETPPGRYVEALNVYTDRPERSPIRIAVNILVRTELYTFPDSVDFGTVSVADLARTPSLLDALTQHVLVKKRQG